MGLSSAVDWWEVWQLRILVIGSQCIQLLLFYSASRRKSIVSASSRLLTWLAYLGSDAVAIYALAALFNRHRKEQRNSHDESVLEVVWAPVLLMHLGGQDGISAYNMEDNELWRRHLLTALAQVTVSIYVFCKSWRGGDKKLLQAAIMLFTLGGIRCLEKPFALQKASFNCLVSSSDTTAKPLPVLDNTKSSCHINSLKDYVKKVRGLYQAPKHQPAQAQVQGDIVAPIHLPDQAQVEGDIEAPKHHSDQAQIEGDIMAPKDLSDQPQVENDIVVPKLLPDQAQVEGDIESSKHLPSQAQGEGDTSDYEEKLSDYKKDQINKLFVDLASPYHDRLAVTKSFLALNEESTYEQLQERLSDMFDLLYTKAKIALPNIKQESLLSNLTQGFRSACVILPFAAIGLFHRSHREAYDDNDVKVTYTLLCCTAVMEFFSYESKLSRIVSQSLCCMVAQYSFMGYFVRNKKYTKRMSILSSLKCKEYVDQRWSMKPSESSSKIALLVHGQVKMWWNQPYIQDAAAYRRFNNHRGLWTIEQEKCSNLLGWSIKRSFDESVLLWHIATDLCFYNMRVRSKHEETAVGCREISNYMLYLLYAKPEMLMAGTRRNLLIAAYKQLDSMLGRREQPPVNEEAVAQWLIAKVKDSPKGGNLIHKARGLAKALLGLNDEEKMWKVIEGVWVEMLCYSASRCRGYLHAKSLGTGVELLTFVWLLWSHMGMETLAERMQMPEEDLPGEEENRAPGEEENGSADELGGLFAETVDFFGENMGEISGFD